MTYFGEWQRHALQIAQRCVQGVCNVRAGRTDGCSPRRFASGEMKRGDGNAFVAAVADWLVTPVSQFIDWVRIETSRPGACRLRFLRGAFGGPGGLAAWHAQAFLRDMSGTVPWSSCRWSAPNRSLEGASRRPRAEFSPRCGLRRPTEEGPRAEPKSGRKPANVFSNRHFCTAARVVVAG